MKRILKRITQPPLWLLVALALVFALVAMRVEQNNDARLAAAGHVTIDFTDLTSLNVSDVLANTQGPILIFGTSNDANSQGEEVILEQALGKYADKVTFLRLDVTAEPDIASAMQITANQTPVLLLVQISPAGGLHQLNQSAGLLDAQSAQQFMDTGLGNVPPASGN